MFSPRFNLIHNSLCAASAHAGNHGESLSEVKQLRSLRYQVWGKQERAWHRQPWGAGDSETEIKSKELRKAGQKTCPREQPCSDGTGGSDLGSAGAKKKVLLQVAGCKKSVFSLSEAEGALPHRGAQPLSLFTSFASLPARCFCSPSPGLSCGGSSGCPCEGCGGWSSPQTGLSVHPCQCFMPRERWHLPGPEPRNPWILQESPVAPS